MTGTDMSPDGETALSAGQCAVLVLDDSVAALNMTEILMKAGYRVVGASATVKAARVAMEEHRIDAALLDIKLDGDTLVFPLAELLGALRVPFAFVSGYPRRMLPVHLRSRPYLTKPCDEANLIGLTQRLMS